MLKFALFASASEEVDVEEVHRAKDEKHDSDFIGKSLEDILGIHHRLSHFEVESDEADVDEVEANDEEVVDAIGHVFVIAKALHEKDATVFVEGFGDPNRQWNGNQEVEGVGEDERIHCFGILFCGWDELRFVHLFQ